MDMSKMEHSKKSEDFNQLFSKYQVRFIHFANSYVRDRPIAEDITIDAFMYYWENMQNISSKTNAPAYILTIIKHKCLNHLQHLQVRDDYFKQEQDHSVWELNLRISTLKAFSPYELFSKEIKEITEKTLEKMPKQTRSIFLLSRFENKSHKEIAEQLLMSVKGVEYHISRALRQLKISLKDYLPSEYRRH